MRSVACSGWVAAFVVVWVLGAGCTSAFPPGSFDWGHGAAPMEQYATRVLVGGGGGLGIGAVGTEGGGGGLPPQPKYDLISGGGAGVAVEHQLLPTLMVRGEGGGGCQSPTSALSSSSGLASGALICPVALYAGAQLNPGGSRNLALRARVGGGGEFFDLGGAGFLPSPYASGQGALVLSGELAGFEPWIEAHGGAKLGILLAPVLSAGVTAGTTYALTDSLSLYGLARGDVVAVFVVPSLTANVQAGVSLTF